LAVLCLGEVRAEDALGNRQTWTIDELVQRVLDLHPDLREAHAQVELAAANKEVAKRSQWPNLSFVSGYSYSDTVSAFIPNTNIPVAPGQWTWTGLTQLQVPLFLGGKLTAEVKKNEFLWKSEVFGQQARTVEMIAQTRELGYRFLKDRAQSEALQGVLEFARESLRQVHARQQEGLATQSEELKTEVRLQQWELDDLRVQQDLSNDESELKILLQLAPESECEIHDEFPVAHDPLTPSSKVEFQVEARPDIRSLAAKVEAFSSEEQSRRSAYFPQISAFGNMGYVGVWTWNTGLTLQWQLFNWGATTSQVNAASAARRASEFRLEASQNKARLELSRATKQRELAWKALQVSKKAENLSQSDLKLAKLAFEQGHLGVVQVLELQALAHQSRSARIQAQSDYSTSEVRVWKASHQVSESAGGE
jgi:outer membrane protein TolC